MQAEYIRKEDAITEICDCVCGELKDTCKSQEDCSYYNALKLLPSADVAPVRHGKWIKQYRGQVNSICSVCGKEVGRITNFCSRCGTKMDG